MSENNKENEEEYEEINTESIFNQNKDSEDSKENGDDNSPSDEPVSLLGVLNQLENVNCLLKNARLEKKKLEEDDKFLLAEFRVNHAEELNEIRLVADKDAYVTLNAKTNAKAIFDWESKINTYLVEKDSLERKEKWIRLLKIDEIVTGDKQTLSDVIYLFR